MDWALGYGLGIRRPTTRRSVYSQHGHRPVLATWFGRGALDSLCQCQPLPCMRAWLRGLRFQAMFGVALTPWRLWRRATTIRTSFGFVRIFIVGMAIVQS